MVTKDELTRLRADSARLDKLQRITSCKELDDGKVVHWFGYMNKDLRAAIDAAPEPEAKP